MNGLTLFLNNVVLMTETPGTDIIADFFDRAGSAITKFFALVASAIEEAVKIFWVAGEGPTLAGVLLMCSVGVGLVWFAIRFIRSLIPGN